MLTDEEIQKIADKVREESKPKLFRSLVLWSLFSLPFKQIFKKRFWVAIPALILGVSMVDLENTTHQVINYSGNEVVIEQYGEQRTYYFQPQHQYDTDCMYDQHGNKVCTEFLKEVATKIHKKELQTGKQGPRRTSYVF